MIKHYLAFDSSSIHYSEDTGFEKKSKNNIYFHTDDKILLQLIDNLVSLHTNVVKVTEQ